MLFELKILCRDYEKDNKTLTKKDFLEEILHMPKKLLWLQLNFSKKIPKTDKIYFQTQTYLGFMAQGIYKMTMDFVETTTELQKQNDKLKEKLNKLEANK